MNRLVSAWPLCQRKNHAGALEDGDVCFDCIEDDMGTVSIVTCKECGKLSTKNIPQFKGILGFCTCPEEED